MATVTIPNSKTAPKAVKEIKPVEEEAPPLNEEPTDFEENLDEDEILQLKDTDPETEAWTGGPTVGTILEWMSQYKNVYVTSISFEEHVAWRPLKRSEYARISQQIEEAAPELMESEMAMLNEELICRICVLFPDYSTQDFDDVLAGIPTLISQQILERSGFTAIGLREMV